MESWTLEAKELSTLEAEICFLLKKEFYYGPDRHTEIVSGKYMQPLTLPSFSRKVELLARTSEIISNESTLADYYLQVINIAQKHKKPFNNYRHIFWIRLWLWNTDASIHISFPWYDSQSEIDGFIDSVITTESGQVYWDADQGWELEVIAENGFLYIRHGSPEDDETYSAIKVPRDVVVSQLINVQNRSKSIISYLSQSIGADLWSKYNESFEPSCKPNAEAQIKPWWKIW